MKEKSYPLKAQGKIAEEIVWDQLSGHSVELRFESASSSKKNTMLFSGENECFVTLSRTYEGVHSWYESRLHWKWNWNSSEAQTKLKNAIKQHSSNTAVGG